LLLVFGWLPKLISPFGFVKSMVFFLPSFGMAWLQTNQTLENQGYPAVDCLLAVAWYGVCARTLFIYE
jgi:hypothetical protein